jgi:hypothetical protein
MKNNKPNMEQIIKDLRDYREKASLSEFDYNSIDLILDQLEEITEKNDLYLFRFGCNNDECNANFSVETSSDWSKEDLPKTCPYCGSEDIFIDWKIKAKIEKIIDVRTCGSIEKIEDIGMIDYTNGGEYVSFEKKEE